MVLSYVRITKTAVMLCALHDGDKSWLMGRAEIKMADMTATSEMTLTRMGTGPDVT